MLCDFVTVIHPGFFSSQCSRSLKWRQSLNFVTFENQGEQSHGELSLKTLRMERCALCVCDLKGMLKHCRFFLRQRSTLFSRTKLKMEVTAAFAFRRTTEVCHFFVGSNPYSH